MNQNSSLLGAGERAASLLGEWILGAGACSEVDTSRDSGAARPTLRVGDYVFHCDVKPRLTADTFDALLLQLKGSEAATHIPLLVVPFMSDAGRKKCREAELAWLDLSGNADIRGPGLRILVSGQPNLFKRPGRVSTAFAPKGSRVSRFLLQNVGQAHSQAEIAQRTGSDAGHVSKVVTKLLAERLIERNSDGLIRVPDPSQLLDAWGAEYDFGKHNRVSCILAARSGQETTSRLAERLQAEGIAYAATGLSAAYLVDPFANYRTATFFVQAQISEQLLSQLELRVAERGGNVWLVSPNDEGVFDGASAHEGVLCAHPVQIYLDLLGHPERAREAAEHLRERLLNWREDVH